MCHTIDVHEGQWKHVMEVLEDETEGCDDNQVITGPWDVFELLRFSFNITNNMDILNLISQYS